MRLLSLVCNKTSFNVLKYCHSAVVPKQDLTWVLVSCPAGSLMGDPVVMVSLYPEFPPAVMSLMTKSGEFLFVIDRSGSMSSPMSNADSSQIRIDSAKACSSCSLFRVEFPFDIFC